MSQACQARTRLFPVSYDDLGDRIDLYEVPASILRGSTFLGRKALGELTTHHGSVNIGDVIARGLIATDQQPPTHCIFHFAYCCSTLLCNILHSSNLHRVLKEPEALTRFALRPNTFSHADEVRLKVLVNYLCLLGEGEKVVFIKPNVPVNVIAADILDLFPEITATYIIPRMEDCLVSFLKHSWRIKRVREWNRTLYLHSFERRHACTKPHWLKDVECVAYWWAENIGLARSLHRRFPGRVLLVQADDVANAPGQVLAVMAQLPSLGALNKLNSAALQAEVLETYSKDRQRPYNAESRAIEQLELRQVHTAALGEAACWLTQNYPDINLHEA